MNYINHKTSSKCLSTYRAFSTREWAPQGGRHLRCRATENVALLCPFPGLKTLYLHRNEIPTFKITVSWDCIS